MSLLKVVSAILVLGLAITASAAEKTGGSLKFTGLDGKSKTFSSDELSKKLTVKTLTIASHPEYAGAKKTFNGYDIFDFLKFADPKLDPKSKFTVEVTTNDGWTAPPYGSDLLRNAHALLAVSEAKETLKKPISDDGLWSLIPTPERNMNPGPFYLVWELSKDNPNTMPFQVATMKVTRPKTKK